MVNTNIIRSSLASPTPQPDESVMDRAPQILKLFLEGEQGLEPGDEIEMDLTPECKKWLDYDNFCALTEYINAR